MKKAVIVGFKSDSIAVAQRDPFVYNQGLLRRSLDLKVKQIEAETFSAISEACKKQDADIIFLLPSWRESAREAESAIKAVREEDDLMIINQTKFNAHACIRKYDSNTL